LHFQVLYIADSSPYYVAWLVAQGPTQQCKDNASR